MDKKEIKYILNCLKQFLVLKVQMNGILEQKYPAKTEKIENVLSKIKL